MSFTGFFQNVTDLPRNLLKATFEFDNQYSHHNYAEILTQAAQNCGFNFISSLEAAWKACASLCSTSLYAGQEVTLVSAEFFSTSDESCGLLASVNCLINNIDPSANVEACIDDTDSVETGFMILGAVGLAVCLLCLCPYFIQKFLNERKNYTVIPESSDQQLRLGTFS